MLNKIEVKVEVEMEKAGFENVTSIVCNIEATAENCIAFYGVYKTSNGRGTFTGLYNIVENNIYNLTV